MQPGGSQGRGTRAGTVPIGPALAGLAGCVIVGCVIMAIARLSAGPASSTTSASRPVNIHHEELLARLELSDDDFVQYAGDFANRCSEFTFDPRMTEGCQRLIRIGLRMGGALGDATVAEGI